MSSKVYEKKLNYGKVASYHFRKIQENKKETKPKVELV